MVEANRNDGDASFWGYLIKPDKSASQNLEQLCLGLARIICNNEPGPQDRLTPRRLASFYKSVGGNLDALFLRTSESGLSFLYRTIGCFHSLEPTPNPFETPSVPCLTPDGFVKWQTVQLLLCPEEHVGYLQQAVRVYDIPHPDGGFFPKSIPREVFPVQPDKEMENWHKSVTSQLKQENYVRRLKNSPYHSPYTTERAEGYFSPQVRVRRPSKPSRSESREGDSPDFHSRRRSEPEFAPPLNPVEHARNPNAYARDRTRSASTHRPAVGSRQRSATTGQVRPRPPDSSSRDRPPSSYFRGQYPERLERHSPYSRGRSPSGSSIGESSADDASSEDSRGNRRSFKSKAGEAASSLLSVLPFTSSWTRRSRSHDASYRKDKPSPRREGRDHTPPIRASTENFSARPNSAVRFKQDIFENSAASSAPESPAFSRRPEPGQRRDSRHDLRHDSRHEHHPDARPDPRSDPRQDPRSEPRFDNRHDPRYARNPGLTDPASSTGYKLTREVSSSSGSEHRSRYEIPERQSRKSASTSRTPTVTGVQGRKYASLEQSRGVPLPPGVQPDLPQQDARTRYSLAV